jgi:hypothetical protein
VNVPDVWYPLSRPQSLVASLARGWARDNGTLITINLPLTLKQFAGLSKLVILSASESILANSSVTTEESVRSLQPVILLLCAIAFIIP